MPMTQVHSILPLNYSKMSIDFFYILLYVPNTFECYIKKNLDS